MTTAHTLGRLAARIQAILGPRWDLRPNGPTAPVFLHRPLAAALARADAHQRERLCEIIELLTPDVWAAGRQHNCYERTDWWLGWVAEGRGLA
jgi:hypothetical protein